MDGLQMDECMDEWMDAWMHGCMDGCMEVKSVLRTCLEQSQNHMIRFVWLGK
jgi:hypothetical protein